MNAEQIRQSLIVKYKKSVAILTLYNILHNIRHVIADYIKQKYRELQIGGPPEKNKTVALDESLFIHDIDNSQVWIVGAKETDSNRLRLDVIKERNGANLKIFVTNHIAPGTKIVTDGWLGYSFLDDDDNSVWEHEIHHHGGGDFGFGSNSTSHIENCWANLKYQIKSIYNKIPKANFIFFLREAEFRLFVSKKNNEKKLEYFKKMLKYVYEVNNFNFFTEEELLNFNNYDY